MGIPRQVEENAQMAEEIMERMMNPDFEDEIPAAEKQDDGGQPPAEQPVQKPAEPDEEEQTYKERYLTLKGKYDAEVPRLSSELSDLKKSVFERLGTIGDKPPEAPKQEEQEDEDPVFAQIREEYGDEYLAMLSRLTEAQAKKVAKEMIAATVKPVEEKVESVEKKQLESAQEAFAASLDGQVKNGDWRAVWEGNDPDFNAFLEREDPSGLFTYGELLQKALTGWDDVRAAKIFDLYLGEKNPPAADPIQQKEPGSKAKGQEALIAPSRTAPKTEPKAEDVIIWTRQKIQEFQANDRKGLYSEEESKRLWNDLLSAPGQNRIR